MSGAVRHGQGRRFQGYGWHSLELRLRSTASDLLLRMTVRRQFGELCGTAMQDKRKSRIDRANAEI